MKIHQFSCREVDGIDLRQANAVLKHQPDLIIREAPGTENGPVLAFNPKESLTVQQNKLKKVISSLKEIAKNDPWVVSDIRIYENVIELLKKGHKIRMYDVDAPRDLLRETIINKWNLIDKPRRRGIHLLWWTYIYLREKIMSKNIRPLLDRENLMVLMFLQKFHWLDVSFLLSNPSKDKIWQYYFGRFKGVNRGNITEIIKSKNKVLYKYWLKHSDFV